MAGAAGMGAALTIAGETGIDQAGVVLEKLVWSEFHPLHHALKVERENIWENGIILLYIYIILTIISR